MLAFLKKPSLFPFKLLCCIISETRGDSGWKSEEKTRESDFFLQGENMLSGSGSSRKKKISGRTVLSQLVSLQKMLDLLKKLRYTNGDKKLVIQLQGLRDGGVRGRSLLWISQQ